MIFGRLKLLALLLILTSCSGAEVDFARSLAVPQPADIVLRNGKIVTVDRQFSIKQAVAIKDGRILAVGSERDMRLLTGPHTRVVDLGGRTVIPGLIDGQIYATRAALNWDSDLHWESLSTLAQGLALVGKAAASRPKGSWIVVAAGWMPEQFIERRLPTRAELDSFAPSHPVYLQYLDRAALLNSVALRVLKNLVQSAEPAGGKFERAANGDLTGWLRGAPAWQLAYSKIPKLGLDQATQGLRSCFVELSRLGITSIHDIHDGDVNFAHRRILAEMARSGETTVRINYYIEPPVDGDQLVHLNLAAAEVKQLPQTDWFRFAGFVADLPGEFGDGRIRTESELNAGSLERVRRVARFAAESGSAFRLLGYAVAKGLSVIEELNTTTTFTRQRIALAGLDDVTAETIARLKKLGAGVVELPGAGSERDTTALRTLLDADIPLGVGSDGFWSGSYSPWVSLWSLVTGKNLASETIRNNGQSVSREEALRMFTMGSAWLSAESQRKGSIEVDKWADLAVLSADYLTVPEDQIRSLKSLLTMVGGRVVHYAKPFGPIEIIRR